MSKHLEVHFSSATDDWATPQAFFDRLNAIHSFELDVCADDKNAKCARYFTKETDGLAQQWTGRCWMNPPYGDPENPCPADHSKCKKKKCEKRGYHTDVYIPGIIDWVRKAYESARDNGALVVCLLPARTDTRWFHEYCQPYGTIEFVKGRLKFGDAGNSAPFPSMIVIFGK